MRPFLAELRRRSVYKVTAVYAGTAFVIWQAAEIAFPSLDLPEWSVTLVVVLTLVGLPVAVVLAWAYELTPEGIVRTAPQLEGPLPDTGVSKGFESPTPDERRLAVLPLANIQADRDEDYFADGMTEELISVISRISGLDVIARTSVMAYRDTTKSVTEIGTELGVGTILEGSVRKAGDQLRITVQLIDATTQGHLWSRDYDRTLDDTFRIQSDIARQVADALQVRLLGNEEKRLDKEPTANLQAYDLYLVGRHEFNRRNEAGVRTAIDRFQTATRLDPDFALAFAALADAYVYAGHGYASIPNAFRLAKESATQALSLDESLPEAHRSLGYASAYHDWDMESSDRELERAVELNPSDAQAHQWHSHHAIFQRRFPEAAQRMRRARELDPLSVVIQNESGWAPFFMGEFETAMRCFQRAASMDASFAMAYYNMGNVHEAGGRLDTAVDLYRKAVDLSNRSPLIVSALGGALARAGRDSEARTLLQELESHVEQGASLWAWKAAIHEALGEGAEALNCLERSVEARESPAMLFDTRHFHFAESLADDPRYRELQDRVHGILGLEKAAQ